MNCTRRDRPKMDWTGIGPLEQRTTIGVDRQREREDMGIDT